MDCGRFDKVVLDALYGELDELTDAAARRHLEHCARCGPMGNRLRATLEVGVLPLVEPPPGLEARILEGEVRARSEQSLGERLGRAISVAAGYSMKPQLSMAALLLLMIGGSFMFLRNKPGDVDAVQVTERGIQQKDESVAIVPLPPEHEERRSKTDNRERQAAPSSSAKARIESTAAPGGSQLDPTEAGRGAFEEALAAYHDGQYKEAQQRFETLAREESPLRAEALLHAALSLRSASGCSRATSKFDEVWSLFPRTKSGSEALWHAASCYRSIGDVARARRNFELLTKVSAYSSRAEEAIAALDAPPPRPSLEVTTRGSETREDGAAAGDQATDSKNAATSPPATKPTSRPKERPASPSER